MGELGEALALMHGAGDRFRTMSATVRRSGRSSRESSTRLRISEGEATDAPRDLGLLVHPAPLLGALRFELLGPSTVAGRDVIRLRALPRSHQRSPLVLLLIGRETDAFDLAVDTERGVILRHAALSKGLEHRVTELVDVAYDE
jgi:hypothetical protein